jgi:hypothetical protein
MERDIILLLIDHSTITVNNAAIQMENYIKFINPTNLSAAANQVPWLRVCIDAI